MKPPHRHPAAPALGGFLALAAALGIGRFVHTPILPYMVAGLGISKSEAGLIASANFLGYLLGALAAARGNVPGSRRAWLLGALAVSALTTGEMGFAASSFGSGQIVGPLVAGTLFDLRGSYLLSCLLAAAALVFAAALTVRSPPPRAA